MQIKRGVKKHIPYTLPETNIAPKNDGFSIGTSFSRGVFSGAMLVSGRVLHDVWVGHIMTPNTSKKVLPVRKIWNETR